MNQNVNVVRVNLHEGFWEGVPEFPLHNAKTLQGFFLVCRAAIINRATENSFDGNRASRLSDAFLVCQNPDVQPACLGGFTPSCRCCEMMACVVPDGWVDDNGGGHKFSLPPGGEML